MYGKITDNICRVRVGQRTKLEGQNCHIILGFWIKDYLSRKKKTIIKNIRHILTKSNFKWLLNT